MPTGPAKAAHEARYPLVAPWPAVGLRAVPAPASAVLGWLMAPGIGEQLPTLEEIAHRPAWMVRAACVGQPIELFFPARGRQRCHHGTGTDHLRRLLGTGRMPRLRQCHGGHDGHLGWDHGAGEAQAAGGCVIVGEWQTCTTWPGSLE